MSEEQVYTVKVDRYGTICWYNTNNQLHRLDGPAVEYADGNKLWYQNGKLHRLDGPAYEGSDGSKEWWIENEKLTEAEFNEQTKFKDPYDGQHITLENGHKYLLTAV